MKNNLVNIILLNYNSTKDTIECIESLREITYPNYRIIVVDNNSTDGSIKYLEEYFKVNAKADFSFFASSSDEAFNSTSKQKKYTLIQSGFNGGYGFGYNIGIQYAMKHDTDFVLLLNNDTIVSSSFLEPLVTICTFDQTVGIASGQIFQDKEYKTFWFNGGKFNFFTGKISHCDYGKENKGQVPPTNNSFITGCLWLIPRKVVNMVGYINEDYFMYIEDVEYCQRVLKSNFKLVVSKHSKIFHKVGRSSDGEESEFSIYWRTKNWMKFMLAFMPFYLWPFGLYSGIVKNTIRFIFKMKIQYVRTQLKAIRDHFSGV